MDEYFLENMGRIFVRGRILSRKHGRIFVRGRIVSRKRGANVRPWTNATYSTDDFREYSRIHSFDLKKKISSILFIGKKKRFRALRNSGRQTNLCNTNCQHHMKNKSVLASFCTNIYSYVAVVSNLFNLCSLTVQKNRRGPLHYYIPVNSSNRNQKRKKKCHQVQAGSDWTPKIVSPGIPHAVFSS